MSRISEISRQYHAALAQSRGQYEEMYRDRAEATEHFYNAFFKNLVCSFNDRFAKERFRANLQERIERVFGTSRLEFVAVDGTCQREMFSDFVTFFGGAYGARGELSLSSGRHQIRYRRWSLDHDVSMVAWVPVPFARLEEVAPQHGEQFLVTDEERVNLSSVHVHVMQLAEIFLAYNTITSSRLDSPQILLMDLLPSSVLASVAHSQEGLGLIGYPYDRRALTRADVTIALSHPFSDFFGIPSPKRMDLYRILVATLAKAPSQPLDIVAVAQRYGIMEEDLLREVNKRPGGLVDRGILQSSNDGIHFIPAVRVDESWAYVREFFQNLCSRLFIAKDPTALQYDAPDEQGVKRRRWLAPGDLGFLVGVGLRLLIEACWERNILLYGIVKDSASRYLTRNFFGVSLETGFHPELKELKVEPLPWTDRIFCETLPLIDEELAAPWCTVEFDSAFMTLHRELDGRGGTRVAGIMGRIVNQERLFARSLAQFFLRRDKRTPLMGHVVFLDRLLSPAWDQPGHEDGPGEIAVDTPDLGHFPVYAWRDRNHSNLGQTVMMYLLSVLTRNLFAEAIGYPDPLHKADWGAKSIGRSVGDTIRSSTRLIAARPLSRTFRDIRDRRRR